MPDNITTYNNTFIWGWRVFRRGGIGVGYGEVVHDDYLEFRSILVPDLVPKYPLKISTEKTLKLVPKKCITNEIH